MTTLDDVEKNSGGGGRGARKGKGALTRLRDLLTGEAELAREVFETARSPYVVTDARGEISIANEAAKTHFGPLPRGASLRGSLSPIARDIDTLAEAAALDGFASRTVLFVMGRGECWYDVSARRVDRPQAGLIWRLEEITERKRRETAHIAENEVLARTLRDLDVGYCILTPEGRLHTVSDSLAAWLGRTPEELVDGEAERLLGAGAAGLLGGPVCVDALTTPPIVGRLYRPDGEAVHVSVVRTALDDQMSGAGYTRSLVRNLSRESDEAFALQLAEHRFRMLFDSAPFAVVTVDRDGLITEANTAFQAMVPELTLIGRRMTSLVAEDDQETVDNLIAQTWAGDSVESGIDVRSDPRLAGRRLLQVFASRMADGAAEATGILFHVIDVTEQRGIETQFAQAQKMQAVGQLAGGVAHDFNNLLTAIIGHTDLLMLRIQPGDEAFPDIMQIKQNANRAANLVRHLLAFSRQQTLRPSVLDLTEVMAEITHLLRRLIGENIELKVAHGRDLSLVKVDKNQFEQVVINLAVNARDAMAGGGRLEIRTENVAFQVAQSLGGTQLPAGSYVHIIVGDTGTGISPDDLDKVFEPFFTTKPQGAGTGLGLSMVYGIVRQTGGFIHAESELGAGTTFHIYLPHHREEADPESAPVPPPPPRDLTGKGTILLVEDENAVRTFAARALRNKGYVVLDCSGGEVALKTLRRHEGDVDLVISDVVMPQIDGPTLVKSIREEYPDLKVIFISGYAEQAFRQSLDDGGEYELLPKPFCLGDLAAKVKDVLGRDSKAA